MHVASQVQRYAPNSSYAAAAQNLRILGGVMAAKCMAVVLQMRLSSFGMNARRLANLGIALAVHIAANASPVPKVGAQGAAQPTLFGCILLVALSESLLSARNGSQCLRWLLSSSYLAVSAVTVTILLDRNALFKAVTYIILISICLFSAITVDRNQFEYVYRSVFFDTQMPRE